MKDSNDIETRHHRRCRSNGGKTELRNISIILQSKHRAFHALFGNNEAPDIARILNDIYIDPDWELIARRRDGR